MEIDKYYYSADRLGIVIVSFNNLNCLKDCISSIKRSTARVDNIIVVDNNSIDGTRNWLKVQKDLTLYLLDTNRGGSYAYNFGISEAIKMGLNYIMTTDEDTIFSPKCIQTLYEKVTSENLDFALPKVLNLDGKQNKNNSTILKNGDVYLSTYIGALFSKRVFQIVGLPYKNLFRFYDDIIFFLKLYNQKNICGVLVEDAQIYHLSQGISLEEYFKDFQKTKHSKYFVRNHFFFLRKRDGYMKSILIFFRLLRYKKSSKFYTSRLIDKINIARYSLIGIIFIPKK